MNCFPIKNVSQKKKRKENWNSTATMIGKADKLSHLDQLEKPEKNIYYIKIIYLNTWELKL